LHHFAVYEVNQMNRIAAEEIAEPVSRWYVSRQAWLLYAAAVSVSSIASTIPLAVWMGPVFLMLLFIDLAARSQFRHRPELHLTADVVADHEAWDALGAAKSVGR